MLESFTRPGGSLWVLLAGMLAGGAASLLWGPVFLWAVGALGIVGYLAARFLSLPAPSPRAMEPSVLDPLPPLARAGHPLATRGRLAMKDLAPYGWMIGPEHSGAYGALAAIFASHRLAAPTIVVEVPYSSEMNLSLLAATDLLTLAPRSLVRQLAGDGLVVLPIAALRIPRAVVLLSRQGTVPTPLMQAVIDALLARPAAAGRSGR